MILNDYELASEWILNSKHLIALTGAGISVESGIPTFRGPDGLWSKYNPVFLDTSYFSANPESSWALIKEIFYDFFGKASPNPGHHALARLEKKGVLKSVITQNIDNLHQAAGSKNVIEFHGTSRTLTCMGCNGKYDSTNNVDSLPPLCPKCGGLLKPDFVFFGEPIPFMANDSSIREAKSADVCLLIGTTGEIMPASMIPNVAREAGAKFIEININESRYTRSIVDIFLKGKATEVLTKMMDHLCLDNSPPSEAQV